MTDQHAVAERLHHCHDHCGIDWGLIANLTQTSLNAVHRGAHGLGFPTRGAELLEALIKLAESSPATTPEGRRDWMFETIEGGVNRFTWFANLSRRNRTPLQGSGYTPVQLLGGEGTARCPVSPASKTSPPTRPTSRPGTCGGPSNATVASTQRNTQ